MTIPRILIVALVLSLAGIAVIALRVEQSGHLRRIQELQFRASELKQQIWHQEMELARLRSPQMIRDRAFRLGLAVGGEDEAADGSPAGR
ncbi:MAG: hypothetical protein ACYTF1_11345 [Planctomycetota bacterium]|jgi:hypothetical protein